MEEKMEAVASEPARQAVLNDGLGVFLNNRSFDAFKLSQVAMPLVRLMRVGRLTWAQREEVSLVIQDCIHEHSLLVIESDILANKGTSNR